MMMIIKKSGDGYIAGDKHTITGDNSWLIELGRAERVVEKKAPVKRTTKKS